MVFGRENSKVHFVKIGTAREGGLRKKKKMGRDVPAIKKEERRWIIFLASEIGKIWKKKKKKDKTPREEKKVSSVCNDRRRSRSGILCLGDLWNTGLITWAKLPNCFIL